MAYRFVRLLIKLIFKFIIRLEVQGFENAPTSGPFIAVSNHLGRFDVPIVYHLLDRRDIIMLVAEKYRSSAFWRWVVKYLNGIFIDRFNADIKALRIVLARLRQGGVLVIAPEGTRSPTGALIEGRPGGSYMAAKSGLDIVPVGLTGTQDHVILASLKRFRRAHAKVVIGKAFRLPPFENRNREEALKAYTDEIMCQIAALLPPEYRGVYSEHPRLLEILNP